MLKPRTLKLFAWLIALFGLLLALASIWPEYLDSPLGVMLAIPYLSVYLFHSMGVPGLLQHNGLCAWGWCAPSTFGWIFLCGVWVFVLWLLAWGIDYLTGASDR